MKDKERNKPDLLSMQSILTNAVQAQRAEEMKTSPQLVLGELILKLEAIENKKLPVIFDDGKYHPVSVDSWRGSYCELAIEYSGEGARLKLADFLKILKDTIGETFTGYKGGDYVMGKTTPVWVANYGDSSGFKRDGDKCYQAVIDVSKVENALIIETRAVDY